MCSHQVTELRRKSSVITVEAADHGGQKRVRVETFKVDGMSSVRREESHERQLAPPVAIPKWVNGIELPEELGGTLREFDGRQ